MKSLVVILTFCLSLFFGGRNGVADAFFFKFQENRISVHNTETPSDGNQSSLGKEMCITGAVGNTFSGNSNSHGSSIRVNQTGRRINPSPKTNSRLVRTGKIIDTHNFNPFLSALFPKADGAQSFFRYIYSICCLRL